MLDPAQCSVTYVYSIALWTVSIYDWLVCLPDEWRAIWKRKQIGPIEVGYLMARYYTMIAVGLTLAIFGKSQDPGHCGKWNIIIPTICDIATWACDAVIAFRCHAIWGRSFRIGALLLFIWVAEVALMITSIFYYFNLPDVTGHRGGCVAIARTNKPSLALLAWIPPAAFCLVVFALTTIKALQLYRQGGRNSLLTIFIQDGALYCFVVFTIYTVNAIFFAQPDVELQAVNAMAAFSLPGIIVSRMILRLRLAGDSVTSGLPPRSSEARRHFSGGGGCSGGVRSGGMPRRVNTQNTILVEISHTRHEEVLSAAETKEATTSGQSRPESTSKADASSVVGIMPRRSGAYDPSGAV